MEMEFGENNERRALSSVRELLKCSVCFDFMFSSIYQCPNGHALCSSCKEREVDVCPNCREELGHIRCLALEKMAESLELQCKYNDSGCPKIIPYYSKLTHEESCKFRPYNCPWSGRGCSEIGDVPFLVSHMTNCHDVKIIDLPDASSLRLRITDVFKEGSAPWVAKVFNCFGEYFCLYGVSYSIRKEPVYRRMYISLMGNHAEAFNYAYKLEVESYGRKFTFEGTPRSIREGSVTTDGDGLIWMQSMNVPFFGGTLKTCGGLVEVEVRARIWKKMPPPFSSFKK